jgi:hypothetical protein
MNSEINSLNVWKVGIKALGNVAVFLYIGYKGRLTE